VVKARDGALPFIGVGDAREVVVGGNGLCLVAHAIHGRGWVK
jgi:hypothetical protein